MVDRVAWHITESGADATIDVNLCMRLVSASRRVSVQERNLDLFEKATIALCRITRRLYSPTLEVQRWACELLANLASSWSTRQAVLNLEPCGTLVSLLRDTESTVFEPAAKALKYISTSTEGAQAAVDARVLERVTEVLELPNAKVRTSMYAILDELARHESIALAVLATLKQWVVLDSSQSNPITGIIRHAAGALYPRYKLPSDTQAAVDAAVLNCVAELLESPNVLAREWTCWMMGCIVLVSQLGKISNTVIVGAVYALYAIARSTKGAQAAVDGNVLHYIVDLLQSPNIWVRLWSCKLLGELASHSAMVVAVLDVRSCERLVKLLRDKDKEVVRSAGETLSWITKFPQGGNAVLDANMPDHLLELLLSPDPEVRIWGCKILGDLVHHGDPTRTTSAVKPCVRFISLRRSLSLPVVQAVVGALAKISESTDALRSLGPSAGSTELGRQRGGT
ncbi:armadillo-type protein [Mycena latifolia]|nr:armadillo-type protein [Mycena latifolia]